MIYTIEILAQQTTALDVDDQILDVSALPANSVDRTISNTIRITVPPSIEFGKIDMAQILFGTEPVQQGQPMLLVRATMTSQSGVYVSSGLFFRVGPQTPVAGGGANQTTIQDLTETEGQYLGTPLEFPIDHTFGVDTALGGAPLTGPHRIVLVVKSFEDNDVFSAA